MATAPLSEPSLDIREQIARIDRMQAELSGTQAEINKWQIETAQTQAQTAKLEAEKVKLDRETRLAPWTVVITGLGAGAALFAAGAAFAKLILG